MPIAQIIQAMLPPADPSALEMWTWLRQKEATLKHDLEQIRAALRALEGLSDETRRRIGLQVERTEKIRRDLSNETYGNAVAQLLEDGGRQPLSTKVLLIRLAGAGRKVRGKDPYRTLYRTLQKDGRFKNISGRWALGEWYQQELEELTGPTRAIDLED